jgi:ABC-type nitrate/sulfonate/bicarbonate transport system substrate-binding protein
MEFTVSWFVEPAISVLARNAAGIGNAIVTTSSEQQYDDLLSGRADAAVTSMDNVMDWNRRAEGADFRILAQLEQSTALALVARPGLVDFSALRGGRLLVDAPANGFVVAARALLRAEGLPPQSYDILAAGGVRERFEALLAGKGDVTLLGPPFDASALGQGAVLLARLQERYPVFPGQGLVMTRAAIARRRAAVTGWLAKLETTRRHVAAGQGIAAARLVDAGLPPALAEAFARTVPRSLTPDPQGIDLLIAQRRAEGLPGADVTYTDLVAQDFLHANAI